MWYFWILQRLCFRYEPWLYNMWSRKNMAIFCNIATKLLAQIREIMFKSCLLFINKLMIKVINSGDDNITILFCWPLLSLSVSCLFVNAIVWCYRNVTGCYIKRVRLLYSLTFKCYVTKRVDFLLLLETST